jgi:hypothetical protein
MKYSTRILAILIVAASLAAAAASGTTISGVVKNGTTGKVAGGVDIVLMNLQSGMDSVATTKTDAEGRYTLNYTPSGQSPMLVRASYKGVNFHAMLPPGQLTADVNIYEPGTDMKGVKVPTRIIYFQPEGAQLLVGEEFDLQNQSSPPVAYFKTTGNFEFQIPDIATLQQVNAEGPERMSVVQGTMDRGGNKYAIAYAFRPGESRVRLSYSIPYPSNRASFHIPSVNSAGSVVMLAPPTVTVTSAGYQPGGTDQGFSLYVHDGPIPANGFDVSVSGTAPPQADNSGGSGQDNGGGRDSGAVVTAVDPRISKVQWTLIAGFASLFLLGAFYLYRKSFALSVAGGGSQAPAGARSRGNAGGRAAASAAPRQAAAVEHDTNDALGEIDRKVGASLDELKDVLFKLELRRQAGTISEQDYAEQRGRAEKILRDLVRG